MEKTHEEEGQKGVLSCHCSEGEDLNGFLRLLYIHVHSTASRQEELQAQVESYKTVKTVRITGIGQDSVYNCDMAMTSGEICKGKRKRKFCPVLRTSLTV